MLRVAAATARAPWLGAAYALWRGALSALSPAHEDLSKLAHAHGDVIASLGELGAGDCDA